MHLLLLAFLLLQAPYWESKPPKDWTNREVLAVLQQSPWTAKAYPLHKQLGDPDVSTYLASAEPCALAEEELRTRKQAGMDPLGQEYRVWKEDNAGKYIILAVKLPDLSGLTDVGEMRDMEKSYLIAGKKKVKLAMHFPPSSTDPTLRLVFPRIEGAQRLSFQLYLPGTRGPDREVEFDTSNLLFKGRPTY